MGLMFDLNGFVGILDELRFYHRGLDADDDLGRTQTTLPQRGKALMNC